MKKITDLAAAKHMAAILRLAGALAIAALLPACEKSEPTTGESSGYLGNEQNFPSALAEREDCTAIDERPLVPEGAERICLSFRALLDEVDRADQEKRSVSETCDTLAGINEPEGFVIDNRDGRSDIVLVGLRWKNRPPLYLDDLVVNVRNIWRDEPPPYCSLDPRPEDVVAMGERMQAMSQRWGSDTQTWVETMRNTIGPQMVVAGGVPFNSRHAHTMIDADYHMKRVSQGHVMLENIPSTLVVMRTMKNGQGTYASQSRYWFRVLPEGLRYLTADGVIWIGKCQVVISTEKQMADAEGNLHDVVEDDPVASAFAERFSEAFPETLDEVPDYATLHALYRLRAVLLAIRAKQPNMARSLGFKDFLPRYTYTKETAMPESYPGLVNYHEDVSRKRDGDYIVESRSLVTVSGGVDMGVVLNRANFRVDRSGWVQALGQVVLRAKETAVELMWWRLES